MKRILKSALCLLLCMLMLVPSVSTLSVFAAPAKVTGLKLKSNTATQQTLTWSAASGAKGYYIYRYVSGSGFKQIGSTAKTTYTVTKLANATVYTYRVRAYSGSVLGPVSDLLNAATIGTPTRLRLDSLGTDWQTLKWNSVPGATGYKLYIRKGNAWELLITTPSTSYTVSGLQAGTEYIYCVRAYIKKSTAASNGALSSSVIFTTRPKQVTGVTATSVTTDSIALKWDSDPKATAYHVYRYDRDSRAYVLVSIARTNTYTVEGLTPLTNTAFRVRAYCSRYNTAIGPFSDAFTMMTAPDKLSGIRSEVSGKTIKFTWDKLEGATGYQVAVYNTAADSWSLKQTSANNSYTITNLPSGEKVRVKVRAYVSTSFGNLIGEYSDDYIAATSPEGPTRVAVALNPNNGITVTWTAVENISGYRVYRKLASEGDDKWEYIKLTANTIFEDNSLTKSGVYEYKVNAYYGGTDSIYESVDSDPVRITYTYKAPADGSNIILNSLMGSGLLGYLYDPVGKYYYTAAYPWQRNFGFSEIYDIAAPLTIMFYDTIRIKFKDYKGYDWMIQVWKGQYGWVFIGGEVGVYTKDPNYEIEFYDCASDENSLMMSLDCYYRESVTSEYTLKFSREYDLYWWATGFVPGTAWLQNQIKLLKLDIRITLKDFEMLDKFCYALEHLNDDKKNDIDYNYKRNTRTNVLYSKGYYTVRGLDVYFTYDTSD